jgi:hypothetical protein
MLLIRIAAAANLSTPEEETAGSMSGASLLVIDRLLAPMLLNRYYSFTPAFHVPSWQESQLLGSSISFE